MNAGLVAKLELLIRLKQHVQNKRFYIRKRGSQSPNQTDKRLLGRGMDFAEVRSYQPGDEIRHMDWRVTARTGRPYVKLYQEERERPVMLVCEFAPSLYFGTKVAFKSVIAAQLAALIAWTVAEQNDRIGGVIHDANGYQDWLPRGRSSGVLPILGALSKATYHHNKAWQPSDRFRLSDLLERLKRRVPPGSLIVLISDFYTMDDAAEKQLARLREHYSFMVYSLWDPFERQLPLPAHYSVTDGHNFFSLDMTSSDARKAYQNYCSERITHLTSVFNSLQVQEISVITGTDLPRLVQDTFASRHYGR